MPVIISASITDQTPTPNTSAKFIPIIPKLYPAKPKNAACPKLSIPPFPQIRDKLKAIKVHNIK